MSTVLWEWIPNVGSKARESHNSCACKLYCWIFTKSTLLPEANQQIWSSARKTISQTPHPSPPSLPSQETENTLSAVLEQSDVVDGTVIIGLGGLEHSVGRVGRQPRLQSPTVSQRYGVKVLQTQNKLKSIIVTHCNQQPAWQQIMKRSLQCTAAISFTQSSHKPIRSSHTPVHSSSPSIPHTNTSIPHANPSIPLTSPSIPHISCPSIPHTHPSIPHTHPSIPHTNPSIPPTNPSIPLINYPFHRNLSIPHKYPSTLHTKPWISHTNPSNHYTNQSVPHTNPSNHYTNPSIPHTNPSNHYTKPSLPSNKPIKSLYTNPSILQTHQTLTQTHQFSKQTHQTYQFFTQTPQFHT